MVLIISRRKMKRERWRGTGERRNGREKYNGKKFDVVDTKKKRVN